MGLKNKGVRARPYYKRCFLRRLTGTQPYRPETRIRQKLHLSEKDNRREFRAVTGGILHSAGGAEDNSVAFTFEKVAPKSYKIALPNMIAGEYEFVAPGAASSSNLASHGKIYTFRIIE
jgi:hypothetical protein